MQTVLALMPETGEVVGCAIQEPFVRTPAPAGETRSKRRQRETRETDVWMRLVEHLGSFPAETLVVHVGDRGAIGSRFSRRARRPTPIFWSEASRTGVSNHRRMPKAMCSMK
ncbi:MAG: hypothetical protein ABI413_01140 [Ktedonobacteraceae bacterium]